MAQEQRTVFYSGQVQGVGFRYTTCHAARGFDVTGYVRNLPDGRVECLAEGETAEIDAFLADLEQTMGRHIRGRKAHSAPASSGFVDFGVRY